MPEQIEIIAALPDPAGVKPSLIGLTREALAERLSRIGVPERQVRMRVAQLWHWLYVRGATDFAAMTNVSKDLRAELGAALHA